MAIMTPGIVPASVLVARPRPAWLEQWGELAAGLRFEDLPAPLVAQARLVLLDCIGAIAAGMQEPEMQALVARIGRGREATGGVAAIGAGRRLPPADAAFVNGTAGTMLELDEGNQFARGHPGIHVAPAALAASGAADGRRLLLAFILGYELAARIGAASRLRSTLHPHGTWGTIGAAFAAAYLDRASAAELVGTIGVAASLCLGTSLRTMLEGATVRNAYAGLAARNGLAARDLAASGFTGETDGVGSVYDGVLAEGFRPEAMVEGLGERWEIQRNYFKRHAACRFTHGALDVVARLIAGHGPPDPASVVRIEVETYALAAQLDLPAPGNMLAAKFSLPFAVATMLVHGEASVPARPPARARRSAHQAPRGPGRAARGRRPHRDAARSPSRPRGDPSGRRTGAGGRDPHQPWRRARPLRTGGGPRQVSRARLPRLGRAARHPRPGGDRGDRWRDRPRGSGPAARRASPRRGAT